jgi:hypothetical protein
MKSEKDDVCVREKESVCGGRESEKWAEVREREKWRPTGMKE